MCDVCFEQEVDLIELACSHRICTICEAQPIENEGCKCSRFCNGRPLLEPGETVGDAHGRVRKELSELENLLLAKYSSHASELSEIDNLNKESILRSNNRIVQAQRTKHIKLATENMVKAYEHWKVREGNSRLCAIHQVDGVTKCVTFWEDKFTSFEVEGDDLKQMSHLTILGFVSIVVLPYADFQYIFNQRSAENGDFVVQYEETKRLDLSCVPVTDATRKRRERELEKKHEAARQKLARAVEEVEHRLKATEIKLSRIEELMETAPDVQVPAVVSQLSFTSLRTATKKTIKEKLKTIEEQVHHKLYLSPKPIVVPLVVRKDLWTPAGRRAVGGVCLVELVSSQRGHFAGQLLFTFSGDPMATESAIELDHMVHFMEKRVPRESLTLYGERVYFTEKYIHYDVIAGVEVHVRPSVTGYISLEPETFGRIVMPTEPPSQSPQLLLDGSPLDLTREGSLFVHEPTGRVYLCKHNGRALDPVAMTGPVS